MGTGGELTEGHDRPSSSRVREWIEGDMTGNAERRALPRRMASLIPAAAGGPSGTRRRSGPRRLERGAADSAIATAEATARDLL